MLKIWLQSCLIVGSLALTSGSALGQQAFKLGVNLERTGSGASYGTHSLIGAQIAVEEINAAGGVNGHKMELLIEDNRSSPEQAVIATRNLEAAGVFAMLGPVQSSQVRTAFPAANRAALPSMSTGSGAPGLTAQNRPWTFRNAAIDQIIIDEVALTLRKNYPQARTVAAVVDGRDAYNVFLVKTVAPAALAKVGLSIVNKDALIEIPFDANDFSVFVTRLKALNPDIVLLGIHQEPSKAFLREALRQKLNVPMFAGLGYLNEGVAQSAGPLTILAGQPFDPSSRDPKVQKFVKEFTTRAQKELPGQYSTPTYIDAGSYEAVYIFANALRKANATPQGELKDTRTKVRESLAGLKSFVGLGNTLSINEEGDAVKPTLIYRSGSGEWVRN